MTAASILEVLWAQGFTVSLVDNDRLAVSPSSKLHDTQRELLRANKTEIVALLRDAKATIEKAKPHTCMSDADRISAGAYHQHHFGCTSCCAAGQGRGDRCEIGMGQWTAYQNEESRL